MTGYFIWSIPSIRPPSNAHQLEGISDFMLSWPHMLKICIKCTKTLLSSSLRQPRRTAIRTNHYLTFNNTTLCDQKGILHIMTEVSKMNRLMSIDYRRGWPNGKAFVGNRKTTISTIYHKLKSHSLPPTLKTRAQTKNKLCYCVVSFSSIYFPLIANFRCDEINYAKNFVYSKALHHLPLPLWWLLVNCLQGWAGTVFHFNHLYFPITVNKLITAPRPHSFRQQWFPYSNSLYCPQAKFNLRSHLHLLNTRNNQQNVDIDQLLSESFVPPCQTIKFLFFC